MNNWLATLEQVAATCGQENGFKDFKDKIRFLRTYKDRANFSRNLRNLRTSGRPATRMKSN